MFRMIEKMENTDNLKPHIGSILIAMGTVLLFIGNGAALGIADNYFLFFIAMISNFIEFILTKKKVISIDSTFVLAMVLLILTTLFIIKGTYDHGSAMSISLYMMLIVSISLVRYNQIDAKIIIQGMIISSVIFSLLIIFFGEEYLYKGTSKLTYTQSFGKHITFEPNYLGVLLTAGFCFSVYNAIDDFQNKRKMITSISFSMIAMVGAFLTGSRSAVVSILAFIILLINFMKSSEVKKRLLLLVGVLLLIGILLVVNKVIPESIYQRIFENSYMDNSNMKRIKDWDYGIKIMMLHPIFGNGPLKTSDIMIKNYGFRGDVHNTFLTIGVIYGIPIFFWFIIYIINIIVKLLKNNEKTLGAIIIAMIIEWNILACQYTVTTWLTIIVAFIVMNKNSDVISDQRYSKRMKNKLLRRL